MNRARLEPHLVTFLLAIGFLAALLILAAGDWSAVRASGFGHSNHCFHQLMTRNLDRRTVLLIGSSRMRENLDPDTVADALGLHHEQVLDFGHPERDPAMELDLVREFSARAPLRLVVVELHVASTHLADVERRLDPSGMPAPARLAGAAYSDRRIIVGRYGDLLRAASENAAPAALFDGLKATLLKVDRTMKVLAARAWYATLNTPDPQVDAARTNICYVNADHRLAVSPEEHASLLRFRRAFGDSMLVKSDRTDFLHSAAAAPDRRMVEGLVQLARERGFALVFVYLPSSFMPVPDKGFAQAFVARFGAPVIVPDRKLLHRLAATHYYDNAHLDPAGRAALTRWIAPRLRAAAATP